MTQTTTIVSERPRSSRRRRVLAGIALVLACLSILVTTMAVWTHQVALNTNRFTSLIGDVVDDPAVTDPISRRISVQVVDALGVQTRLEARLPDAIKPLAGALTAAVTERIDQRLRVALQNPRIQNALVGAMSFTHTQLVRLLRGQSDVVGIVDGYLTLDVFPVVDAALRELQSMGLIPAAVEIPDLTAPDAPEVLAQRLESALGVTLPPDFGTIQLMPAERLATARTVVRVFDLVVILLVALSAILVALALWLARDRRRMLIYLGLGTLVAFLLARLAMNAVENAVVGGIADGDVAGAMRTVVDTTLQDLRGVTVLIVIATIILVIAAYLWGRPRWAVATASYVGDTAGRAGSAAGAAATAGAASVGGRTPDRAGLEQTVRENRSLVERYGLAIIAFVLVWIAIGLEVALLGAALVIGLQLLLHVVGGPDDDQIVASDPAVVVAPTATYASPVPPMNAAPPPAETVKATAPGVPPSQPDPTPPAAPLVPDPAAASSPPTKASAKPKPVSTAKSAAAKTPSTVPKPAAAKAPSTTSKPAPKAARAPKPKPPTA
jgi:hypothetical protein